MGREATRKIFPSAMLNKNHSHSIACRIVTQKILSSKNKICKIACDEYQIFLGGKLSFLKVSSFTR